MLGDINIDVKADSQDARAPDYLDMLAINGLLPAHTLPTRLNNCLDHCFIKSRLPISTIVCDTTTTDHSCVMVSISNHRTPKAILRKIKKTDYSAAIKELESINWPELLMHKDANKATSTFISLISNTLNKYTNYRTISRSKHTIKPWITPGLVRCMRNRDRLHLKLKKDPNNAINQITYRRYRNTCNNILNNVKRAHLRSQINANTRNLKKQWALIKNICKIDNTDKTMHLLNLRSSPLESVNYANKYFTNIGKDLATEIINKSKLSETERAHSMKIPTTSYGSMFMIPTDDQEVKETILSLKSSAATGWDGISSLFLKMSVDILSKPLATICNLCFQEGKFPDDLKKSVVIPIFKSGDSDCITNYRPISLLPTVSKVIEKLINKRLKSYLEKNNILAANQYGFRTNKSTEDAIRLVTSYIVDHIDNNKKVLGIFLDMKKAFDTVSVPVLIKRLEMIGIRGEPLLLLSDYLTNRKQVIRVGEHYSAEENVIYGVPQGSVLGPTLFLIYLNELCLLTLNKGQTVTFADDTVLLFQDDTWPKLQKTAQEGLDHVTKWLNYNLLTLNSSKTKCITFSMRNNTQPPPGIVSIKAHICQSLSDCTCIEIENTDNIRYLGIELDKNLNWNKHILNITARVRKLIYIFKSLRHVCDSKLLTTIYYALCQSIASYCITAWGGAARTRIMTLERAQRAVLKVMIFKNFRYPTRTLYSNTSVLTIRQLYIRALILMQHQKQPDYSPIRRRCDFVYSIPTCKSAYSRKFHKVLAPKVYNRVSKHVQLRYLSYYECRKVLDTFLKTLSYEDTEQLIK